MDQISWWISYWKTVYLCCYFSLPEGLFSETLSHSFCRVDWVPTYIQTWCRTDAPDFLVHWNQWHWSGFLHQYRRKRDGHVEAKSKMFKQSHRNLHDSWRIPPVSPEPGLLVINFTCSLIVDGEISPVSLVLFGDLQVASSCVVFLISKHAIFVSPTKIMWNALSVVHPLAICWSSLNPLEPTCRGNHDNKRAWHSARWGLRLLQPGGWLNAQEYWNTTLPYVNMKTTLTIGLGCVQKKR